MPMRAQPELFWEAFAGTAAVSRCLVGAPMDLVAWLGGKRRVAKLLLRVLGLHPRQGARSLLLSDPGPWGWVWPVLLDPVSRARVVAVLRRWATGCPACSPDGACAWCGGTGRALNASELWGWLASRPPAVDLAARTAGWLWLQARAASGAAIWWGGEQEERDEAGWRMGEEPSKARRATRTGYGWDLEHERVLQLATRAADARAKVLITEGGPLARRLGPGWHSANITAHFTGRVVGEEWITCNFPIELGATRGRQHGLPFGSTP